MTQLYVYDAQGDLIDIIRGEDRVDCLYIYLQSYLIRHIEICDISFTPPPEEKLHRLEEKKQ